MTTMLDEIGRLATLTPRELDVLRLTVRGLDNRAIAAELGIGYATVRSHVRNVLEKLEVHSRLEAVVVVREMEDRIRAGGQP